MGMAHVLGFQLAKHLIKLRRTSPSNCDLLEPIRSILNGGNELTRKTFLMQLLDCQIELEFRLLLRSVLLLRNGHDSDDLEINDSSIS